jgi:hypothetical protein
MQTLPTRCDLTEDDFLLQSLGTRQVEEDRSSHGVHPESRPRYASVFTPSAFPTTSHISLRSSGANQGRN